MFCTRCEGKITQSVTLRGLWFRTYVVKAKYIELKKKCHDGCETMVTLGRKARWQECKRTLI